MCLPTPPSWFLRKLYFSKWTITEYTETTSLVSQLIHSLTSHWAGPELGPADVKVASARFPQTFSFGYVCHSLTLRSEAGGADE